MGYKVDYASMQGLMSEYSGVIGNWNNSISSVIQKEQAIEVSTSISGNRANNMKQYLATVYSCASDSMMILLELFRQNYLLYIQDYYSRIDSERGARIDAMELSSLRAELQEKRSRFQQMGINAENSVGKVSDIVSTPSLDIAGVDTKIGSIITSLDNLDRDINTLESEHASADFEVIDEMLSNLDAYFMELIGQSKEFKTGFSPEAFYALASISGLSMSLSRAFDQITAQKSNVALAMTNLEKRLEQDRKELEERQKRAKYAKIGVNIAVGVVSAVCIAACPAAAPVVGMVSGFVTSTVSAALDEYAEHGFEMSEWDTGRIGAHACIGTVTGLIGGCVSPGAGIVAKAGVKGISSALEGAMTTSYDQLSTYGRIVDTKAVLLDAAEKGGASFAGSLAGGYISENMKTIGISKLDLARNDPLSKMHGMSVFLYEGGKSAGVSVVKRGVSNLTGQVISNSTDGSIVKLNEIDFASIRDDMFSVEKIGEDFVESGLSGMASDYVEWRTPDEKSGLTPIIQYKLGHTTDQETGLTAVVQESLSHIVDEDEFQDVLRDMEERNPSTGGSPVSSGLGDPLSASEGLKGNYASHNEPTTDWENTASSSDEIRLIQEMDEKGEFDIMPSEMGPASYVSDAPSLTEKPIEITFTYDADKYDVEEFLSQGYMQEEGLNGMSVAEYLDNYERYKVEGRAPNDAQNDYRIGVVEMVAYENSERQIADAMGRNPSLSYEEASALIDRKEFVREARNEVSSQAALHNPDQIAGGDPENVHAMGSKDVNYSYGGQWKGSRAEKLHEEVLKASQGMTREEMERTRLNVRFNYKSKNG